MQQRNPKQVDSNLIDCIPQTGPCPRKCNQCFYNECFYHDFSKPLIPSIEDAEGKIVRMNSGHDSNLRRHLVIKAALKYKDYFFNTSIANFDLPGPVVYTANADEERPATIMNNAPNLMFIRLRVSVSNIDLVNQAIHEYTKLEVPVVLTFMRYYDEPSAMEAYGKRDSAAFGRWTFEDLLEHRKHVSNQCWQLTRPALISISHILGLASTILLTMCGTFTSSLCKDCRNCEHYYWLCKRRIEDNQLMNS